MSNIDWFRLWTMEQEKQGFAAPEGSEGSGNARGFSGDDGQDDGHHGGFGGFGGGYGGFGGMHSGYSAWAHGDTGWRPHLFSETSQTECPSSGAGRSFGSDYHDGGHSTVFPFDDDGRIPNGGGHGSQPGPHGGDFGGGPGHGDGFDAILFGHLDAGGLHAGFGPGSLVVIPIEHLEINQNTLIQNTNILFDAHDGGSVSVGGDVTAISSQTGLIDHGPELQALPA